MTEGPKSWESHGIRIHPTLWKWAQEDAEHAGYKGGASALISGLILYNHALRRKHWLTAGVVNNPAELEKALAEIEHHNPLDGSGTWIEHRLKEIFHPPKD
jgi:hypothetical protein